MTAPLTARVPRGIVVLSLLAATVVIVQLARMSVYMARPAEPAWPVAPWNPFATPHSCLSGYWAAARQIDTPDAGAAHGAGGLLDARADRRGAVGERRRAPRGAAQRARRISSR